MDIFEVAFTVLRRWYVVVPVLMVTAVVAFGVASTAETHYEATGSFLLTDASIAGGSDEDAPGVAVVTPQVVGEVVQGDPVRARVREQGGTPDYEIDTESSEGLMRVSASGQTEQAAVTSVQLVLDEVQRELDARQDDAGLPEQGRVRLEVLAVPSTARQQVVNEGTDAEAVRYVARGSLRFILPPGGGENPYAASLGGTLRVLEEVMASPRVRQEIAEQDTGGTYEVAMNARDAVPIINVTGRSTSPDGAMDTFGAAVDRLRGELQERQQLAGAPAASLLSLHPLSMPVGVSVIGGELRRPLIIIVGLGLVAAVSLAVLVEALATRLRQSRTSRPVGPPREGVAPDGFARERQASETVPRG